MENLHLEMKRIAVNVDNCSGCRRCEILCAWAHENQFRASVARVNVIKEDIWGFDFPVFCSHCEDCTAMKSCPSKALRRDAKGLITLNEHKCRSCGNCETNCRLHAIRLHPDKKVPLICDLCNGKPICVEKCPTEALTYVDAAPQNPMPSSEVLKCSLKRWKMLA